MLLLDGQGLSMSPCVDVSLLVCVVVNELNSIGDILLDSVQFLLHVTGPYEMCVAF